MDRRRTVTWEDPLASKDMFLLAGGNPFYLRWLMKATGADEMIIELVKSGKVYSGASAAAVVAGPTLRHFDNQDDPNEAKEIIWDGLNLTDIVIVPHVTERQSLTMENAQRECEINRFPIKTLLIDIPAEDYGKLIRFPWGSDTVAEFIRGAIDHELGHARNMSREGRS